jgi:prevent-host-death family protein
MQKIMKAGQFKAECLRVMEEVARTGAHIIITKRNIPIVEMIPAKEEKKRSLVGWMKGTFKITGDIIGSTGEEWDACR